MLCNGIGASLDLLQPFVDALDPAFDVVRFDVPGVGGSPAPGSRTRSPGLPAFSRKHARPTRLRGRSTCSASPGAVESRSSSRSSAPRVAGGWCWSAPRPASLMVPARPGGAAQDGHAAALPGRRLLPRVAADLYGGPAARGSEPGRTADARRSPGSARAAATCTSSAGVGWTSLPFLPLLRQQTLILAGDDDPIIPLVNARLMNRLHAERRLHVFHGGHLGLVTEAAELGARGGRVPGAADPGGCAMTTRDRRRLLLPRRLPDRRRTRRYCTGSGGSWRRRSRRSSTRYWTTRGVPVRLIVPGYASARHRGLAVQGYGCTGGGRCWTA